MLAELRVVLAEVCESDALVSELDALAWGCHRTIPDNEPDAACRRRPALLGSAAELAPLTLML